jgi:hypothetical protein
MNAAEILARIRWLDAMTEQLKQLQRRVARSPAARTDDP